MAVQPWICFLLVWLTKFNFSNAAKISSPELSPTGTLIDKQWWRAPSLQTKGPLCNAEEVKQNSPKAHEACSAECINLSRKADIVFAMYSQTRSSAKIVSRQCSGFTRGICKTHFLGYFPMCWCRAKDFQQMSFVCHNVILEWTRVFLNSKTRTVRLYNASVKPQIAKLRKSSGPLLDNAKVKAANLWESSVRPRLPARFTSEGSSLPGSPKAHTPVHGQYDESWHPNIQGQLEHDEFASGWPPQNGRSSHSPTGLRTGTPGHGPYDGYRQPNMNGQFEHDEFASGWPPHQGSRSNSRTGSQAGTPVGGLNDEHGHPNDHGQFEPDEFAQEWPPQKGSRPHSLSEPGGAENLGHDDFFDEMDPELGSEQGPHPNGNTHPSLHDQPDEFAHDQHQFEPGDYTSEPWNPQEGNRPHSGTPLRGTPLHGTPLYGTPLYGTPLHGTPLHGTPLPGTPLHGTPLPGTPLYGTPLHGTPLHGTPLPGTPLHGTPLSGTRMTGSPRLNSPTTTLPKPSSPQHILPKPSSPRPSSPQHTLPKPSSPRPSSPTLVKSNSKNNDPRGQPTSNQVASEQSSPQKGNPPVARQLDGQPSVNAASKQTNQPAPSNTSNGKNPPKKSKFGFFTCCFRGKQPKD